MFFAILGKLLKKIQNLFDRIVERSGMSYFYTLILCVHNVVGMCPSPTLVCQHLYFDMRL